MWAFPCGRVWDRLSLWATVCVPGGKYRPPDALATELPVFIRHHSLVSHGRPDFLFQSKIPFEINLNTCSSRITLPRFSL